MTKVPFLHQEESETNIYSRQITKEQLESDGIRNILSRRRLYSIE